MAITKITTPELFNLQSNNTEGTQLPVMTTTEREAMTGMSNGELIFNSTTDSVEYYDAGVPAWYKIDYDPGLTVDYLVVAGGGGAAWGGGGAGGYRTSYGTGNINGGLTAVGTALTLEVATSYTVTVGTAGSNSTNIGSNKGGSGGSSIFSTITSLGGLGGSPNAGSQGSGDGGAAANAGTYGFRGGTNAGNAGSGGGGAGAQGVDTVGAPLYGTNGGVGLQSDITVSVAGTGAFYAGGGGGGNRTGQGQGLGGNGGGGNGSSVYAGGAQQAINGGTNTGGGGGGSSLNSSNNAWNIAASGGTGVVILRYPAGYTASSTLTHVDATVSGSTDRFITITGTGTGTVTFA